MASEKGEQLVELAQSTFATYYSSQLATTASIEHVPLKAKLLRQPKAFLHQPSPLSLFFPPIGRALPSHRAHLKSWSGRKGPLDVIAFLVYPAQTATTGDCIATYSFLTDSTGIFSRFLQQVQIQARDHNLCLSHVHSQAHLLYLRFHVFNNTRNSSLDMNLALIIKSSA